MGTRFYDIVVQRNREQLEKVYDYYLNSTNKEDFNPAFLHDIEESLSGNPKHTLVLYATEYFLYVNDMKKELEKPIYGGQDLDDLLYFFDVDYILHELELMERSGKTEDGWNFPVIESFTLPIYAKYVVLLAAGMESAVNYDMADFDQRIEEELKREKYNGSSLLDLVKEISSEDDLADTLLFRAVANTFVSAASVQAQTNEQLANVVYKKTNTVDLTLDKISSLFFNLNAPPPKENIDGQMSFIPAKYERDKAPEINLLYNYRFDDDIMEQLKLKKKITDEDYFILCIIGNEYLHGNFKTTPNRLYKELTGTDPNQTQLTEFTNQLVKMASTIVYINDKAVKEAWKIIDPNDTYKEIIAPVAPITIGTERFTANGKVVRGGIYINAFPALLQIGHSIGQYTTIPKALLQVKKADGRAIKRTDRFYAALHCIIKRIAQIKNGTAVNKILYSTYHNEVNAATPRAKQLANTMLFEILDHFVRCGWINGYKEEVTKSTGEPGLKIYYEKQKKITAKSKKSKTGK